MTAVASYVEQTRAHVVNGTPVPSVTQILKATGVSADFSHVDPLVLERKRLIGQAAHAATHYWDQGDLARGSIAAEVEPYLAAWTFFRGERRFVPELLETVVYSRAHHFIGRFDRLGWVDAKTPQARRVMVDIKLGDPDAAAADLQLAGYLEALREEQPDVRTEPIERWSVRLLDDGRYTLRRYPKEGRTERLDRADFLSLARVVNLRQERRGGPPCWM